MPVLKPLSGAPEAPQQHSQPSRKGKKAWRKNVDVSEVEKGLEKRIDEIIQGGVLSERPSDALFTVDVVGDAAITKSLPRISKKKLRADEIIAQRSAVPAVDSRKRPADKTTDGILPAKRVRKDYVSQKELHRLRRVADGQHETTVTVKDAAYDVWAAESTPNPAQDATEEGYPFIPKPQNPKAPETLRHKTISLAANGKDIPAVAKPKGGMSYNPLFDDYVDRLEAEGAKAVEAEKQRLAAEAADLAKAEASARSAAEAEAAEARAELSEWEEDSAWEGFTSGGEDMVSIKAKRPERKTQAQRNRIKRRKEEEQRLKHQAAMKRKNAQAVRVKEIAQEVAEREQALALARVERDDDSEEGDDDVLRRKQLGKFRLPEKDLELVLPDELADSLRLLKPEGNLLKDRYRSLLVRGKMEARRRIPFKKQAKAKVTEKWSHKDFRI